MMRYEAQLEWLTLVVATVMKESYSGHAVRCF
jgi:hypothetical protein